MKKELGGYRIVDNNRGRDESDMISLGSSVDNEVLPLLQELNNVKQNNDVILPVITTTTTTTEEDIRTYWIEDDNCIIKANLMNQHNLTTTTEEDTPTYWKEDDNCIIKANLMNQHNLNKRKMVSHNDSDYNLKRKTVVTV
jgi:hypothetical protein